jgi:uncharacterized protein (TIGR01777 family)
LVGSALLPRLRRAGHEVAPLSRERRAGIFWNPASGEVDLRALERFGTPGALIHLAGENIAAHRWSADQKRRIRDSRVAATEKLLRTIQPPVFIGASATGIYGDRGDEVLGERSSPGEGFLSDVAVAWENAAAPLRAADSRVVHLRFGMILADEGGALAKMLPIFRAGLGGPLGPGTQWMSWIAMADVLSVIEFALASPNVEGPLNTVAPNPVTNREFTRSLGSALGRPALLPAPAFALRLAFGEMADALLLSSQRALPEKLLSLGFKFDLPDLKSALKAILGA